MNKHAENRGGRGKEKYRFALQTPHGYFRALHVSMQTCIKATIAIKA